MGGRCDLRNRNTHVSPWVRRVSGGESGTSRGSVESRGLTNVVQWFVTWARAEHREFLNAASVHPTKRATQVAPQCVYMKEEEFTAKYCNISDHVQKSDQKKLTHKCFIKKMSTEWPFSTNTNITIYNEWQHGNVTLRGHTQNDNRADFVPILPLPDHEDYPLSYKIILYDYPVVCRVLRVNLSR